mmetsp:Transcript_8173/g.21052  ORF Transcript_8173/g.21052 Transcript_8173/m.21052 type:complete len:242 (-) Transcript_8173:1597-2322(-)
MIRGRGHAHTHAHWARELEAVAARRAPGCVDRRRRERMRCLLPQLTAWLVSTSTARLRRRQVLDRCARDTRQARELARSLPSLHRAHAPEADGVEVRARRVVHVAPAARAPPVSLAARRRAHRREQEAHARTALQPDGRIAKCVSRRVVVRRARRIADEVCYEEHAVLHHEPVVERAARCRARRRCLVERVRERHAHEAGRARRGVAHVREGARREQRGERQRELDALQQPLQEARRAGDR